MDKWIITEGVLQLVHAGIKCLFIPQNLWRPLDKFELPVDSKYILTDPDMSPSAITARNPFVGEDPGYHGSELSQEIISDTYYNIIKERWNLCEQ
jgi:hypothetical protein